MNISFPRIKDTMVSAAQQYSKPEFVFQVSTGLLAACQLASKNAPQVFGKIISAKLLNTLDSINFFSIYGLLSIPRKIFFPINSDTIDKRALLENFNNEINSLSLAVTIEKNKDILNSGITNVRDSFLQRLENSDTEIAKKLFIENFQSPFFAKIIKQKLDNMEKTKEAYSNATDFRNNLKNFVAQKIISENSSYTITYNNNLCHFVSKGDRTYTHTLNLNFLDTIEIPLGTPDEKLVNLGFGLVDIQLSLLAFREWKIIDTTKWALNVAHHTGLKFIETTSLDLVFRVTLVATFAIKCHEAWYLYCSNSSNLKKQIQTKNQNLTFLDQDKGDLGLHIFLGMKEHNRRTLEKHLDKINGQMNQKGSSDELQQEKYNIEQRIEELKNQAQPTEEEASFITQQVSQEKQKIFEEKKEIEKEIAELEREIKQMQWNLATSAADLASNTIGLLNHVKYINAPFNLIYGATLIARTLNAVRIIKGF